MNPTPKEASHNGIPSNPELYSLLLPLLPQPRHSPLQKVYVFGRFAKLGVDSSAGGSIHVMISGGMCVGRRFLFDGIEAIWVLADKVVQFYGEDGSLLKTVEVPEGLGEWKKAA